MVPIGYIYINLWYQYCLYYDIDISICFIYIYIIYNISIGGWFFPDSFRKTGRLLTISWPCSKDCKFITYSVKIDGLKKRVDIFYQICQISVIFYIMKQVENSLIFPWHVFVKIPWLSLILPTFSKFPDFSLQGLSFTKFPVFPDFFPVVGTR